MRGLALALMLFPLTTISASAGVAQAPRVGSEIRPPTKIKDVRPQYPAIAQSAGVQGVVVIELTLGRSGNVESARVLRSIPLLDDAALDAVRQWQYTPTLLDGVPVPVIMTVTVNFILADLELPAQHCAVEGFLRSSDTGTATTIRFINEDNRPRRVYSLDTAGKRELSQTVVAGTDHIEQTLAGHPWVVTDVSGKCMGIYIANERITAARLRSSDFARAGSAAQPEEPTLVSGTVDVYKQGGGVTLPRVVHAAQPKYTADAMRAKIKGTVVLEGVVNVDGTVSDVKVLVSLDPLYGLDQEAVMAAEQWKFAPGTLMGVPVRVLVTIDLAFVLK